MRYATARRTASLLNGGRVTFITRYRIDAPCPWNTRRPLCSDRDVSSVGVNVWNAMSISPRWSASFIVDDFEKYLMMRFSVLAGVPQ